MPTWFLFWAHLIRVLWEIDCTDGRRRYFDWRTDGRVGRWSNDHDEGDRRPLTLGFVQGTISFCKQGDSINTFLKESSIFNHWYYLFVPILHAPFPNSSLNYCALVQFWGGQQNILRVILETYQNFFYTTLYISQESMSATSTMHYSNQQQTRRWPPCHSIQIRRSIHFRPPIFMPGASEWSMKDNRPQNPFFCAPQKMGKKREGWEKEKIGRCAPSP